MEWVSSTLDGMRAMVRLVAKDYTQTEGENYHNTFAPVAKMATVRTLFSIAAAKSWDVHQLDINDEFHHGDLPEPEEVYMELSKGYPQYGSSIPLVWNLNKSIYGLKKASRLWFEKLSAALLSFGFKQTIAD